MPRKPNIRKTWFSLIALALLSMFASIAGIRAQIVGDFNQDSSVDFTDFLLFAGAFGSSDAAFDLDGDADVGFPDFLLFVGAFREHNNIPDRPAPDPVDPVSSIDGPIVISSSQSLTEFLARVTPDSFEILGDLRISGTQLADLTDLSGLWDVEGDLMIEDNGMLGSLQGLDHLTRIGRDLQIVRNVSLTSLAGLEQLKTISGDLVLTGNAALASVRELSGLTSISGLISIRDNLTLESLVGLEGIRAINGSVLIENNASLMSMVGLQNLASIGQVLSIRNNESLETLEGLEQLDTAQGLVVTDNATLLPSEANALVNRMVAEGFTGLTTIAQNNVNSDLTVVTGSFFITDLSELETLKSLGGDRFLLDGNLRIVGSDLSTLEPLLGLVEVTGSIFVDRNPLLGTLDGFFGLRTIGGSLEVTGNTSMVTLFGVNRVRTINGHLVVFRNRVLRSISALNRLQFVGETVNIRENSSLADTLVTAFHDSLMTRGFTGSFSNVDNGP
jgi:hypothetical protein